MSVIIVASNNGNWESDHIGMIGSFKTSEQVSLEDGALAFIKDVDGDSDPSKLNTDSDAYREKIEELELNEFVSLNGFVGFIVIEWLTFTEIYAFYDTSMM